MKKMLYIYNPSSGSHNTAYSIDKVIECFQAYGILIQPYRIGGLNTNDDEALKDIFVNNTTSCSKDFIYEGIVVNGGDGTINHMVNLMRENKIELPLGIIPSGTCNDFARNLGIPLNIEKCIEIIANDNIVQIDIGILNEKSVFLNTCAGGQFVNASFSTNGELKKNFGPLAYYIKAISELTNIKPFTIKVITDKGIYEEDIILFIVLNGKSAAGLNNIIKIADMTDGMMDIMLIRNCSHIDLASLFIKVLVNDSFEDKRIQLIRTAHCSIEGSRNVDTSVDGEKGPELPLNIRFVRRGIKIWQP